MANGAVSSFIDRSWLSLVGGGLTSLLLIGSSSLDRAPSWSVSLDVRRDAYVALAAVFAAAFAAAATALAIVFGVTPGERLTPILQQHGRRLVNSLAADVAGLFVVAILVVAVIPLDRSTNEIVPHLAWGLGVTGVLLVAHFGAVFLRFLRTAMEELKDA